MALKTKTLREEKARQQTIAEIKGVSYLFGIVIFATLGLIGLMALSKRER